MHEYEYEGLTLRQGPGGKMAALAEEFWNCASDLAKERVLWNSPEEVRRDVFLQCIEAASLCAIAWEGEKPIALCWLVPLSHGSPAAAIIHFFPADASPKAWRKAGRAFLCADASLARKTESLLAFIPAGFLPGARLLCDLNFDMLALLPRACHLASENINDDCCLYLLRQARHE